MLTVGALITTSLLPERLKDQAEVVLVVEMSKQSQAVELVLMVRVIQTLEKLQLLQTCLVPKTYISI